MSTKSDEFRSLNSLSNQDLILNNCLTPPQSLYLVFTKGPEWDPADVEQELLRLKEHPAAKTADDIFNDSIRAFNYHSHPLLVQPEFSENSELFSLELALDFLRQAFSNPAEFTFTLVAPFKEIEVVR